jgi:UDP-N-acetyl-D-galactosamine dehydrogenase
MKLEESKIAIIGLGYVGLPLAVAFAEKYPVIGFDINQKRVNEVRDGIDSTLEIENCLLKSVTVVGKNLQRGLFVTNEMDRLSECNIFIVTVPTPTDKHNRPILFPLIKASETVAKYLKFGDIVIYESTVYPGVTEDEMVPVLELKSGLKFNIDFFCGYSPERINPGDKERTVKKILKVTSGSTPEVAFFVNKLYQSIISAGTFMAPSIKVAEAAKVIENSQRDINIAFVNELSKIFNLIGIDTYEVLNAASTKWNFLNFKPGLVGGHCIGVDPYYLAQKAQEVGYHPEIILAGRRLNDSMGAYVAELLVKRMLKQGQKVRGSNCLVLGFTFKEDCPDVRNTKVINIIRELESYGLEVTTHDPWADPIEVAHEYEGLRIQTEWPNKIFDSVVLAVTHNAFKGRDLRALCPHGLIFDVKGFLPKELSDFRL